MFFSRNSFYADLGGLSHEQIVSLCKEKSIKSDDLDKLYIKDKILRSKMMVRVKNELSPVDRFIDQWDTVILLMPTWISTLLYYHGYAISGVIFFCFVMALFLWYRIALSNYIFKLNFNMRMADLLDLHPNKSMKEIESPRKAKSRELEACLWHKKNAMVGGLLFLFCIVTIKYSDFEFGQETKEILGFNLLDAIKYLAFFMVFLSFIRFVYYSMYESSLKSSINSESHKDQ